MWGDNAAHVKCHWRFPRFREHRIKTDVTGAIVREVSEGGVGPKGEGRHGKGMRMKEGSLRTRVR